MLTDFLTRSVTIKRETDVIFSGDVVASLDFTQLSEDAFLSFTVAGATSLTILASGLYSGASVSESVAIASEIGNRGFQQFSSLTSLACSGVLSGKIKVSLLNADSEPLQFESTIGTYSADKSYKAETHGLEAFGEEDNVPGRYKFFFETSVGVQTKDILTDGLDKYRVQDVVELTSVSGPSSHLEVTVSKFPAEKEFATES